MGSPWSAELTGAAASHLFAAPPPVSGTATAALAGVQPFPQAPMTVAEAVAAAAAAAAAAEAASAAAESALAAADVFAGSTIDLTGEDGGGAGFSGARRYTPGSFSAAPPASGKRLGSLAAAEPPVLKRHRSDGLLPGLSSFGLEPGGGLLPAGGAVGAGGGDDGAGPGLLSLMMLRNRWGPPACCPLAAL